MKTLILISLLFISTSQFSQDKTNINAESLTDRAKHWMTNIATNPHMRFEMVQKILAHTKDKHDEMLELAKQILDNTEMKKVMREAAVHNAEKGNKYASMLDMFKKDKNIMKEIETPQKPVIKD